mmetsp:Transcript_24756/g.53834  ORF Transcript_24756/g.53834 Transcript_24756/m.53834 type:complete len:214 (+) Transcript_24756:160-801(+)|eukprot:CAMPEP_0206458270 /NCGR_PEP_ID=MMETSP0324_2-20121206/23466_1 /ASSEMBLY_ACC=CAM_ASM_000836 /TAXON_ID=2866 /ORGANISM="Crypthecodinium cohnii, Strain Seligo" /LENGTH=213 /DNA_ID=CAMNT_0053929569 /DNA_START=155 /DNA_END=796 /DNA_ORIENTATION=+
MSAMKLLKIEPENMLTFVQTSGHPPPSKTLRLTNNHSSNVAFKVKTTAPKAYLVRPSTGTLTRGQSQDVQILFQSSSGSDIVKEANTHRFLVQAVAISGNEQVSRDSWASFKKEEVQEQRLGVSLRQESQPEAAAAQAKPSPGSGESLQASYDELVHYTLRLEKEKKHLETELSNCRGRAGQGGDGFSLKTLFLTMFVTFFVAYCAQLMMTAS